MGLARVKIRRLASLFAFHAPVPESDYEESVAHRGTGDLPRTGALDGVRWRWVLAAGVGVIPQLLSTPVIFTYVLASAL